MDGQEEEARSQHPSDSSCLSVYRASSPNTWVIPPRLAEVSSQQARRLSTLSFPIHRHESCTHVLCKHTDVFLA